MRGTYEEDEKGVERVGKTVCSEEVGTPFQVLHSSRAVSGIEMIKNVGGEGGCSTCWA